MKRKKCAGALAVLLAAALTLTGCSTGRSAGRSAGGGLTIRISMYNDIAYSAWRTYVDEQCPEVSFVWENNRNSTQNLIYQAEHGDLADIVTIRRFENDSAAQLAPWLMDLGSEPLAASFTDGALAPFTFDGRVCWYPAPGMIEALYANVSLFERCGIPVPQTTAELESACKSFGALGINGVSVDASAGYRSTFLLEGFGYAPYFSTEEGQTWLGDFLAGTTTELSPQGGAALASLLRDFKDNNVLEQSDLTASTADALAAFDTEKAAMITNGSDHTYTGKAGTRYQVIPCLGRTREDQILYTYPVFSTAVSKEAADDPEKKAAVEHVLEVMYSAEAQQILAQGTEALLSYNDGVELPVSALYASVGGLISDKKCFIRFLNRNTFSAASAAVRDMLTDGGTDESFTENFNAALTEPLDTTVIGTSNVAAGNQLGEERPLERAAASVIAQAARDAVGADAAVIEAKCAAAPIYRGNYTESDLNACVADEGLYRASLTGAQLQSVFDSVIRATTTYRYHDIEPVVDYPALGGLTASLSADGKESRLLLPDGSALDADSVYDVVVSKTIFSALGYLQNENAGAFAPVETTLQGAFRQKLAAGKLPQPAQYFRVEATA